MHKFLLSLPKRILILVSLALISLLFTSITSAQNTYKDPVIDAARDAGSVMQIGKSKTIGNATVTVDWAYADTQNLMVSYTLKTANGVQPKQLLPPYSAPNLGDDKGAMFSYSNVDQIAGNQPNEISIIAHYYTQPLIPVKGSTNFDVNNNYFSPPPDKLNLKFEVTLGGFSPSQGMFRNQDSTKAADYIQPVGPFNFDFTIPLYAPVVLKQTQSLQVKGVTMTLEQVTVTPTKTSARVCYTMPSAQDWIPDGSAKMGGTSGNLIGISIVGSKENESNTAKNRCRDLSFYVFHDTKPAALTINIDHLATSLGEGSDDWNKIKAELAKQNIKIDVISVDHGLDVKVLSVPEGVDYDQAVIEAREAIGNWQ